MTHEPHPTGPFRAGAVVIATLANPREKFWGAILHLSHVGLSLRGVDLSSFDDFVAQIRDGEPFAAGVLFFPIHRVERLELDLPEGTIPSLAQRFAQKTGQDPAPILVNEFLPPDSDSPGGADTLVRPAPASEGQSEPGSSSQTLRGQECPRHTGPRHTDEGDPSR